MVAQTRADTLGPEALSALCGALLLLRSFLHLPPAWAFTSARPKHTCSLDGCSILRAWFHMLSYAPPACRIWTLPERLKNKYIKKTKPGQDKNLLSAPKEPGMINISHVKNLVGITGLFYAGDKCLTLWTGTLRKCDLWSTQRCN